MKLSADGEIEWETLSWEDIHCSSSDTNIRVKCDGRRLHFSGNIGRFGQPDNLQGLTVMQCVERWAEVLRTIGFDLTGFGTRDRVGTVGECGTYLTRLDLAANMETDNYAALCTSAMGRRVGQQLPKEGRWGPIWGYQTGRRGNWTKFKLYDKTAEIEGRRRPSAGATTARFEATLGSEWLKRYQMDSVAAWKDDNMATIIYGKFADQVFREQIQTANWSDIPIKLRQYAIAWRDGADIRNECSKTTYYRVRQQLLEGYGIDIGVPCNVQSLTRRVQTVTVRPLETLRQSVA